METNKRKEKEEEEEEEGEEGETTAEDESVTSDLCGQPAASSSWCNPCLVVFFFPIYYYFFLSILWF